MIAALIVVRRAASGCKSSRKVYARFCERLGVQFPGPTRRPVGDHSPYADLGVGLVALQGRWQCAFWSKHFLS